MQFYSPPTSQGGSEAAQTAAPSLTRVSAHLPLTATLPVQSAIPQTMPLPEVAMRSRGASHESLERIINQCQEMNSSREEDAISESLVSFHVSEAPELQLTDKECKQVLGHGHLGVVVLPSNDDKFEQPCVHFSERRRAPASSTGSSGDVCEANLLVFGGSKFAEREPNPHEMTSTCLLLSIWSGADDSEEHWYELTYLPKATLRTPDKFFGNMQMRCDANHNTVTIMGRKAAHRIRTGAVPSELTWKAPKTHLGYENPLTRVNYRSFT